jgi:Family of unknown function (DUF6690)
MASRPVIIAGLLGASVGVPYLASHAPAVLKTTQTSQQKASEAAVQPGSMYPAMPVSTTVGSTLATPGATYYPAYPAAGAQSDGAQFTSVGQVLRFDITKDWVYQNWSRVLTGTTDVGLFSTRVALVMRPQLSALAGSLTYYFNAQGQVEHISFRGRTGDTTPLVQFLTQSYQFQRVESPVGEQVYQVEGNGGVQSELRTRPESVVRSNAPLQGIVVELEFARPGSERVLPPRGPFLNVPPAPATEAGAAESQSAGSSGKSAASSYFQQVRHATPDEEHQLMDRRWPN